MAIGTDESYTVYILANRNNKVLYIGMTGNIKRRMLEHITKANEGFTARYNVNRLVYVEHFKYVNEAIAYEKRLKKWNRQWKIKLIETENECWNDLAKGWFTEHELAIE